MWRCREPVLRVSPCPSVATPLWDIPFHTDVSVAAGTLLHACPFHSAACACTRHLCRPALPLTPQNTISTARRRDSTQTLISRSLAATSTATTAQSHSRHRLEHLHTHTHIAQIAQWTHTGIAARSTTIVARLASSAASSGSASVPLRPRFGSSTTTTTVKAEDGVADPASLLLSIRPSTATSRLTAMTGHTTAQASRRSLLPHPSL